MWILAQLEPGKGYKINLKLTALLCGFSLENTMLFDSHLHLDQLSDENIQKTFGDSKITGMLAVSTNLKSAKKLLNLKQAYPEKLYIAAGFHPEQSLLNLEEQDELFGYELGVDEYVSKPFSPKILIAKIKAILQRHFLQPDLFALPLLYHILYL